MISFFSVYFELFVSFFCLDGFFQPIFINYVSCFAVIMWLLGCGVTNLLDVETGQEKTALNRTNQKTTKKRPEMELRKKTKTKKNLLFSSLLLLPILLSILITIHIIEVKYCSSFFNLYFGTALLLVLPLLLLLLLLVLLLVLPSVSMGSVVHRFCKDVKKPFVYRSWGINGFRFFSPFPFLNSLFFFFLKW